MARIMSETIPKPSMKSASVPEQSLLLWVTAVVILFDQFSKYFIEHTIPLYNSYAPFPPLAPFFQLTHATNTGAAFGIFPEGGAFFSGVAIVVMIVILAYNYWLPQGQYILRLALGLQLGGAMGNFIDRLRLGYVTDFFDIGSLPIFNVADAFIVIGVLLLCGLMLKEQQTERK